MQRYQTGFAYSKEFDTLNRMFTDANQVAEAMSFDNATGVSARALMNSTCEHVSKGIGYYLYGGKMVRDFHDRMFVGALENGVADLDRLADFLGLEGSKKMARNQRKNTHSMEMVFSETALKNLYAFYDSDYAAIREMEKYGLIAKGLYNTDSKDSLS